MATGETYRSLSNQFRVHHTWISHKIIPKTLSAICRNLQTAAFPQLTEDLLRKVAEGYERRWSFPHCVGSVDGKHIRVRCPPNTGSSYFSYKEYFSIVLFALVDHNYKFLAVDVGSLGKESDAGIFAKSPIGKIINEARNFPSPHAMPGTGINLPYVALGDEAFKLTTSLMRPYPQNQAKDNKAYRIYNYRHCRARRTVENAFGLISQVFRIFYTPIAVKPETIDKIILSCCIIHNFLREEYISKALDDLPDSSATPLPSTITNLPVAVGRIGNFQAYGVRDQFKNYFCSPEGSVPWQNNFVDRTE